MCKILFISHDASRTGAPIVLLHLLKWLSKKGIQITVLLKKGGELELEFNEVAPTYKLCKDTAAQQHIAVRGVNKIRRKLFPQSQNFIDTLPKELINESFDLIYLNTIVSLDLAPLLKHHYKCPVLAHVHENEYTISYYYPEFLNGNNISAVDKFIAVSKSTKENLILNHSIKGSKISLIYECIDIKQVKQPNYKAVQQIKEELNLEGKFIIGGSGLTSWRKGVDLFVQLSNMINSLRPNNDIKMVWVGAITHEFKHNWMYESKRLNLENNIIFTGSQSNPEDYFHLFNVFALTSREDPFPLVALEAAAQAKPIICFEESGGIPELLAEGGGIMVPYGNVQSMADQILYLYDNPSAQVKLGKEVEQRVQHFDVEVIGPQILLVTENLVKNSYA
ncbi:glycosyltransferase family 4 protein [Pontibacter harenae]|uniref:glycosyltransferase family 4 protein n=1 Tax=Pontibacter harenae TaxID=2894083 RepID=UPI001E6241C5|nr:glycosyltransferase family 4 protein [Pontibacter harenae]MCC9168234.1 glycosyltransferase family 4 protein [Pontibacter harenae]